MHVCRVAPLPQPTNTEDAIVEMLKYSQKDMDQAIALVQSVVSKELISFSLPLLMYNTLEMKELD